MDIAALIETKSKGKGIQVKHGYILVYSADPQIERATGGVALAIKKQYKKHIRHGNK